MHTYHFKFHGLPWRVQELTENAVEISWESEMAQFNGWMIKF
jgi:hypothetical protein